VLALYLQGDAFTAEEKRRDFDYYDPITTGDSSLSAVVQSIMAAEVGLPEQALSYFYNALWTDLDDLHGNTADGVHVASTGGVWAALVQGFGGMRDFEGHISFDPRLPREWTRMRYRLKVRGSKVQVDLTGEVLEITLVEGSEVEVSVRGKAYVVRDGEPVRVNLEDRLDDPMYLPDPAY
jgi:alpha,alpha-trehalose phosphorylase